MVNDESVPQTNWGDFAVGVTVTLLSIAVALYSALETERNTSLVLTFVFGIIGIVGALIAIDNFRRLTRKGGVHAD